MDEEPELDVDEEPELDVGEEPKLEVVFLVDGGAYALDERRATILGEELRRAAAGQLGDHGHKTRALTVANDIENVLVGASDAPIDLKGDAPEAVFHYIDLATTSPTSPEHALFRAIRRAHYRVYGNVRPESP